MRALLALATAAMIGGGCAPAPDPGANTAVTQQTHTQFFPILAGTNHALDRAALDGKIACESCHTTSGTFAAFSCTTCHEHPQDIMDRIHVTAGGYRYTDEGCYSCHKDGVRVKFDHGVTSISPGITSGCIDCHDQGKLFPPDGTFVPPEQDAMHPAISDCGGCHTTTAWLPASGAPNDKFDPNQNFTVDELVPSFSGTVITSVSPNTDTFTNVMKHTSTAVDPSLACVDCHVTPDALGVFHESVATKGLNQPTVCNDCHLANLPHGFVGMNAGPVRTPNSGEMRHEAVEWASNAPTATNVLKDDCGKCHTAPDSSGAVWLTTSLFHGSTSAQPGSCTDCHANTRPQAPLAVPMHAGLTFDHQASSLTLGDCSTCHKATSGIWNDGKFHTPTNPNPATCADCHEGDRPTTSTNWTMAGFGTKPFDYGPMTPSANPNISHGAGQECALCHQATVTAGHFNVLADWVGGNFVHGAGTPSAMTCVACHATQRPTTVVSAFDHSLNGTGDCFGCHQATVTANHYNQLSDWTGGQQYPGSVLTSAADQFITLAQIKLIRTGGDGGFVTGSTTANATLYNAMLHTSGTITAPGWAPGGTGSPDYNSCWHCHTSASLPDGGHQVSQYINGQFHSALADAGLMQPAGSCDDCHLAMVPTAIVEKAGSDLIAMDHGAPLTNGAALKVSDVDCHVCHGNPGVAWNDGAFHQKIGAQKPADCVGCHYPLMADAAKADLSDGGTLATPGYKIAHRSAQITQQDCAKCHTDALGHATGTTANLFRTGYFHKSVTTQPTLCLDCHASSVPPSTAATKSAVTYTLAMGSSATNGPQWMNHGAAVVVGKDCSVCHAADAQTTGSTWAKTDTVHNHGTPATCQNCHGTTNAGGAGNNNLPVGLTDSTTVTTADSTTGVSGKHDQIDHTDLNVTNHDCNFCHTQVGPSTTAGIMGKEWAQARFHASFNTANPLVMNGTTGRCSHCHLNVKPLTPPFMAQDHTAFVSTSGTQDCASCHPYPDPMGNISWLGASGRPHGTTGTTSGSTLDCNSCHGQTGVAMKHLAVPVASHYLGVSNGNTCISCHVDFTDFSGPVTNLRYAHSNSSANSGGCIGCHAYASQLYTTKTTTPPLTHPTMTGGHQFSQTFSVTGTNDGRSFTAAHTDTKLQLCGNCHTYTTTTATTNIWAFKHEPNNPGISHSKSSGGCNECH